MGYSRVTNPVAEEYLLQVMELDPGDVMAIPMEGKESMLSMRFQLFQTRKALQDRTPLAHSIVIETKKEGPDYFLILRRVAGTALPATIIKKDGTTKTFRADTAKRKERIYAMLLSDIPVEEISEVLEGLSDEEKEYVGEKKKLISEAKNA